jgi:hypothetical protein
MDALIAKNLFEPLGIKDYNFAMIGRVTRGRWTA